MLPASAKLYSADDHLIEPAHLWVDRVPAKYKDRCPRIIEVDVPIASQRSSEVAGFGGEVGVARQRQHRCLHRREPSVQPEQQALTARPGRRVRRATRATRATRVMWARRVPSA